MGYKIPDNWPLPKEITWYTCNECGMLYGDGEFNQAMLNEYYTKYYGYGVSNPDNIERLKQDARRIAAEHDRDAVILDFGGAGDGGVSVLVEELAGFTNARCINPGEKLPACDVIYASHVLEHIYDLRKVMMQFVDSLNTDGTLIVDVPDAYGLLARWKMPILDFNTKHINHFTLRNMLDLGFHCGFEMVDLKRYELEYAPCFQAIFKRVNVAHQSALHIKTSSLSRELKLNRINYSVNIWGMSDIVWHALSKYNLKVLNYIDSDPAYRGQTYNGKPVLERPDNDSPILILAQGQRGRLIENIRKAGVTNQIIEI